ncbi:Regulator of nonsense transcripts 1 [Cardamine amara subsp. amara]|uniref:Regulator of nonsense transcripts 1 n=1 Tax=Cardamine amara subsp. amara TaxID=228776 RepID=A0ABD1A2B8_CARAN
METKIIKKSSSSIKLLCKIKLFDAKNISEKYKPKCGDLIALTKERPRRIDDLNPLLLGYVFSVTGDLKISVHLYRSISPDEKYSFRFGVVLMNLITNTRIWNALHNESANSTLIQSVLQENTLATKQCLCCVSVVGRYDSYRVLDIRGSTNLNSSQEAAILSCLETRSCIHKNGVKLIWGPPGTGKTKTVVTLLFDLIKQRCKTVLCTPTNIAVVEVASRLVSLLKETSSLENTNTAIVEVASMNFSLFWQTYLSECTTHGLGNIVLPGKNGNRQ